MSLVTITKLQNAESHLCVAQTWEEGNVAIAAAAEPISIPIQMCAC